MKKNKHSLKISRSYFGETTLDGYYNDKGKCDMWDELSVPEETEECANQIDV